MQRVQQAVFERAGGPTLADPTPDELMALRASDVQQAWRDLVGSPAGWTLAFVGDLDVEASIPVIERWLASIPAGGPSRPDAVAQMKAVRPQRQGARSVHVATSEPDQCLTALFVPLRGELAGTDVHDFHRVLVVLASRLDARMREELGATYDVSVPRIDIDGHPRLGGMAVVFDSGVASRARLVGVAREEIDRLRREPPSDGEVAAVRADERASWEEESKAHGTWAWALASGARGDDPRVMLTREREIAAMTPASLHAAAKRWIGDVVIDVHATP